MSTEAQDIDEDTASWEDLVYAVVNSSVCELAW
jgi:hypothetical protein